MSTKQNFSHETLPSGKIVVRRFGDDDSLLEETQSYGRLEIGIQYAFEAGRKISETYFSKRRIVKSPTMLSTRLRNRIGRAQFVRGGGCGDDQPQVGQVFFLR